MTTKVTCDYLLFVAGNQTQASLHAQMAAVPLDLSLPRMWGLIPISDITSNPFPNQVKREVILNFGGPASVAITPVFDASPFTGNIRSLTLGATSGFFAAPPIITIAPPPVPGLLATAVPVMGVTQALVANGGAGYTGATTAALVGGNLAPGGSPAVLGGITIGGGVITHVNISNTGSGYTTYPSIVFTDVPGGGSGAEAYGALQVVSVTLNSPGSFYNPAAPPVVTVTPLYVASNANIGFEPNDVTLTDWMLGQLQIACRSPMLASLPGLS